MSETTEMPDTTKPTESQNIVENDWTIMVYLAGDNNLSEEMARTLSDLRNLSIPNLGQTPSVSFLVYFNSSVRVIPPLYCDIIGKSATSTFESETYQKFLRQQGDAKVDFSSSKDSIVNFVKWCVDEKSHKAKNYALFLSGHSNAFDESTLLRSDNSKEILTIRQLKEALDEIYFIINDEKESPKPLDILGFDSCQMSMLEIGYEFKNLVRYLIGSQGETPNAGWNYGNFLNNLIFDTANKNKNAKELAQDIVVSYINLQRNFELGGRSVDIAAWDLNETLNVIEKVEELFNLLGNLLLLNEQTQGSKTDNKLTDEQEFSLIVQQQIQKSILMAHWRCQSYWFEQAVDLKDFCEQLFLDIDYLKVQFDKFPDSDLDPIRDILESVRDACNSVVSAVNRCVIAIGSLGANFQFSNGISLFFPWSIKAFRLMEQPYLNLSFTVEKGKFWMKFLDSYLQTTLRRRNSVLPRPHIWEVTAESKALVSTDEQNETRGTREDVKRGTKTDVKRGTLAFLNEFKSFKNDDFDNWEFFNATIFVNNETDSGEETLKFSENIEEFKSKLDR